jgi:hypothetical protein
LRLIPGRPLNFLLLLFLDVRKSSEKKWVLEVNIRVSLHILPRSRSVGFCRLVNNFSFLFGDCESFLLLDLLQTLLLDFLEGIPFYKISQYDLHWHRVLQELA